MPVRTARSRKVRVNLTIDAGRHAAAKKAGLNLSAILDDALEAWDRERRRRAEDAQYEAAYAKLPTTADELEWADAGMRDTVDEESW